MTSDVDEYSDDSSPNWRTSTNLVPGLQQIPHLASIEAPPPATSCVTPASNVSITMREVPGGTHLSNIDLKTK